MTIAKGSLVGTVVTALCFTILGFYFFVAGPMAPLVGGFVVGNRMPPSARGALAISFVLGLVMLLLMLNSGRITREPPYLLLAAYVVGVLGLSTGLSWLGIYLGRRAALWEGHEPTAQPVRPTKTTTARFVSVLRQHRYLARVAFGGLVLWASLSILFFLSFRSGSIWWFDIVWFSILMAMLLAGLAGIGISFSHPGSWVPAIVTTAGIVIGGATGGSITASLIVWLLGGQLLPMVMINLPLVAFSSLAGAVGFGYLFHWLVTRSRKGSPDRRY